jgi:hypothetical protein
MIAGKNKKYTERKGGEEGGKRGKREGGCSGVGKGSWGRGRRSGGADGEAVREQSE